MKISYKLFVVLFLLVSTISVSQIKDDELGLPNELDKKFTPDKGSLFNSSDDKNSVASKNADPEIKNVISCNVALIGRSTAAFLYERTFGKILSLQVGAGAVLGKDYIQQIFIRPAVNFFNVNGGYSSSNSPGKAIPLYDIIKNSVSAGTSIYGSAGLRLYLMRTAPKGVFFDVGARYSSSKLQMKPSTTTGMPYIGTPAVSITDVSMNVTFGYQFVYGSGKAKVVNTLFGGIGIKYINYTGFTSVNNNYSTPSYYIVEPASQTQIVPAFIIGYCLGFGL